MFIMFIGQRSIKKLGFLGKIENKKGQIYKKWHMIFTKQKIWILEYVFVTVFTPSCVLLLLEFCTEWPAGLETDEKCEKHFPLEVESSDYLFSSPSIRHPKARVVTIKVGTVCCSTNFRDSKKVGSRVPALTKWLGHMEEQGDT